MTVSRTSILLVLALAFSACDTLTEPGIGSPPGEIPAEPTPEPQLVSLEVRWDRIAIEGDCDVAGIRNAGEFEFGITQYVQATTSYTSSVYHVRETKKEKGESQVLNLRRTYDIRDDQIGFVKIEFEATEWDTNFGGSNIRDRDMDERTGTVSHSFRNGAWSNLGSHRIRLGSTSSCRVELRYTASVTS